jgi:hypothetical protein
MKTTIIGTYDPAQRKVWIVSVGDTLISPRVIASSAKEACEAVRRQFPKKLALAKLQAKLNDS